MHTTAEHTYISEGGICLYIQVEQKRVPLKKFSLSKCPEETSPFKLTNSSGMSERKQGTAQPHRDSDVLGFRANLRNGWSHGTLFRVPEDVFSQLPNSFSQFFKVPGANYLLTHWHRVVKVTMNQLLLQ